jgi:hypothetical protein
MEIRLRQVTRVCFEFVAWLKVYDPRDPDEKYGTIGIGCGAELGGVVERKDRGWRLTGEAPNQRELGFLN